MSFNSSESGPNISWPSEQFATLYMDGAYTGQTRETFDWEVWVNDSLGVDTVIFRFKWSNSEEWLNRTAFLVEGSNFSGKYEGNLTWPAPGGGTFQFKVFADNTLGYWNETSPMTVHFGYMYWDPIYIPFFWIVFVIIPVVSLVALVGVLKLRRKLKASGLVEPHLLLDSPKCSGLL